MLRNVEDQAIASCEARSREGLKAKQEKKRKESVNPEWLNALFLFCFCQNEREEQFIYVTEN